MGMRLMARMKLVPNSSGSPVSHESSRNTSSLKMDRSIVLASALPRQ